jgi:hypothetical protein
VPKRQITLRLDAAILDYYRATGPRWQSRLNADLAAVIKERQLTEPMRKPVPANVRKAQQRRRRVQ